LDTISLFKGSGMKIIKLKEFKADLLLLSVAIAWGVTFLMVQDAIKDVPVYAFLFWRFLIATVLMFALSYNRLRNISKDAMVYGTVLGLALFGGFATQTFGLTYIKSSIVAFITGFNVIIVPFLAFLLFKDKVRLNVFIGSFVALTGLYFLTMSGTLSIGFGEMLTLVCALMFAIHIVLTGKFSTKADVFLIVCFQFLTVTVLSLCFSLTLEAQTFSIEMNAIFLKAVIVTSLFATVYAFFNSNLFSTIYHRNENSHYFYYGTCECSFFWGFYRR
jgi:drug/metabolite transporter (DMT)-like permease